MIEFPCLESEVGGDPRAKLLVGGKKVAFLLIAI